MCMRCGSVFYYVYYTRWSYLLKKEKRITVMQSTNLYRQQSIFYKLQTVQLHQKCNIIRSCPSCTMNIIKNCRNVYNRHYTGERIGNRRLARYRSFRVPFLCGTAAAHSMISPPIVKLNYTNITVHVHEYIVTYLSQEVLDYNGTYPKKTS